MPRPTLFLRSLGYLNPSSLFHRAWIRLRNRVEECLPAPKSGVVLSLAPSPPHPLFPPRSGQVLREGGSPVATLLGRKLPLALPMDWTPAIPHLDAMHLHYMEYLEGLETGTAVPLVLDWIHSNPPRRRGAWRTAWNSYALSLRVAVWMQSWVRNGWTTTTDQNIQIRRSLCDQLRHLATHLEMDIRGNHLIKNLKALVWGSRFFQGPEADGWGELGQRLLDEELKDQILADGMHFELSPSYHLQVFADLLEIHSLLPEGPRKERRGGTLDLMAQALANLTHPDGLPSLFGDGGLHMAHPPSECLRVHGNLEGTDPAPKAVFCLPEAGYFGFHAPDECLIVDCGPIAPDALPAHGHGDALAFEWSVGGRRVIVDTGVFEYREGPRRARARGTRAHNTVTLDGRDQAEFWHSFRLGHRPYPRLLAWKATSEGFHLQGSHNGYAHLPGKPVHLRSIEARPQSLRVEDRILGGRGQQVEARLHLHPDFQVHLVDGGAEFGAGELRVLLTTCASVAVEPAAWWPDLGVERPSTCLVLSYGQAPCAGGFSLEPCSESLPKPSTSCST